MTPAQKAAPGRRILAAVFGLALLAYPRAFRARFGDEMRRDFFARPSILDALRLAAAGIGERRAALERWSSPRAQMPGFYTFDEDTDGMSGRLRTDLRDAVRGVRRAPLFSVVTVAALALGIGASAAIFTVAYRVLARPLPYRAPEQLMSVWSNDTNAGLPRNPVSPADFADLRERARPLASFESYFSFVTNGKLAVDGRAENARTVAVSPGLFALLGRDAAVGRALAPSDEHAVVLSDGFWRRRFGGDPRATGKTVAVDDVPYVIAGVMPRDFVFPYKGLLGPTGFTESLDVDLWMPIRTNEPPYLSTAGQPTRATHFLGVIGRLRPNATLPEARARLDSIAAELEREHPVTNDGWKVTVAPLHEQVIGEIQPALLVLAGGVLVILLMVCLNVANLALAQAIGRRGELALRLVLGASRARLALQALLEYVLLSTVAAAGGLLIAIWGVRGLLALAPADLPRLGEVRVDWLVAGAAVATSALTGLAVGLAPALVAARAEPRSVIQEIGRGSVGSRPRRRLRSALVVAEIALAVVLAIAAGLLMRSFGRLLDIDPGFRLDHVLTAQINIPDRLTSPDARRAFYETFFARVRAIPGVISAGATTRIPLGSTSVTTSLRVEGRPAAESHLPTVEFRRSLGDYFSTMGVPLLRGRTFSSADGPDSPPVAVVNEALVRRVFLDEDPIGRHVRTGPGGTGPWLTIVGVVGDVRHSRLECEPDAELYISGVQNPPVAPFIAIRTAGNPADLAERLRAEARALDPTLTLFDVRTMEEIYSASLAERRFVLTLIVVFGVLALAVASVGVYGVTSLVAIERTQEAGVRLALGAAPSAVFGLIVSDAAKLAAAGAAIGLVLAAALSPLLASELYGVPPLDPVTFAATPCLLVAVAVFAAMLPGWRAMRVDPVRALNSR